MGDVSTAGALRVLHITDTHLFENADETLGGVNTAASESAVMERVLGSVWPVDLILATGDLVHDGSARGYRRLKREFELLGVPTLVVPGNHDDPAVMRRVFDGGLAVWSESEIVGGWHFAMLNTWRPDSPGGAVGEAQLRRLDGALTRHAHRPTVVALHHHPVPVGSDWIDRIGVEDADALFDCLDRHEQVRAIVWGHVHQAVDAERHGVRLLATPSTCIQFLPRSGQFALDHRPAGFRWLTLSADGRIATGVERLDGPTAAVDLDCSGYR